MGEALGDHWVVVRIAGPGRYLCATGPVGDLYLENDVWTVWDLVRAKENSLLCLTE